MAKTKAQQALEFVRRQAKRADSATDLHNAFFGNGGQFQKLFPTRDQREAFLRTAEYREIVQIRESLDRNSKPASVRH